jgi:DnaJ-class molecular chaperone
MPTFYEILGVPNDATEDQIKKAYKKLAFQLHPDRNSESNSSAKFQELNEANEVLSDPAKRLNYDNELNGVNVQQHGVQFRDMNDIFKSFFGGAGLHDMHVFHGMHQQHGQFFQQISKPVPIVKTLNLTMAQAYTGGSFPLELERWNLVDNTRYDEKLTVYINIPCGIDENEIMIIRDNGNSINNTIKGDIKIHMKIENNTEFKRQGLDLIYKKTVTLKESLCGFEFEIKHISGKTLAFKNVVNPFIIKPGFKKVIPEFGMKRDNNTGNLIIDFDIVFPDKLTPVQMQSVSEIL